MNDQQSDMRSDSSVVLQPVVGAAWRYVNFCHLYHSIPR